jgi:hypothetical protein
LIDVGHTPAFTALLPGAFALVGSYSPTPKEIFLYAEIGFMVVFYPSSSF